MTEEIKQIIRVANTDIKGHIPLYHALTKIKGVSFGLANAIINSTGIERTKKVGSLTDSEIAKIESCIKEPSKNNIPSWMLNRQKDVETGTDRHIIGADLRFYVDQDIKIMKKLKTYKGVRHSIGQPVRGQRTKAHFRKGISIGVQRNKAKQAAAPKKPEGKK
jgi:small subunit ribosomal protein S13